MQDLKLTADGDLDCSELDLQLVDGAARVAQQVRTALRTFLGEWEFDLDAGTPWFQSIIGIKGVSLTEVDNRLRARILGVADVLAIVSLSTTLDRETRQLSLTAKISTTFGAAVVEGVFP